MLNRVLVPPGHMRCPRCLGRREMYKINGGWSAVDSGGVLMECPMCLGKGVWPKRPSDQKKDNPVADDWDGVEEEIKKLEATFIDKDGEKASDKNNAPPKKIVKKRRSATKDSARTHSKK